MSAIETWSATPALNVDLGGISTDGTITLVKQLDNMLRGMMAEVRVGIDAGQFINSAYSEKSGNYTAVVADRGKLVHFTAAAVLTLTAAATLTAGWWIMVRGRGGEVIVDPNSAETINGDAQLTIPNGTSAIIFCDGTNFFTLADNSSAAQGGQFGCTISNNASDATNDIDITTGTWTSSTSPASPLRLLSNLTKRLDAAWAVGTNQGGRMSAAAIADGSYHVHLIRRPDTGVVDVGFDVSATSPTMPTNYTQWRRIASIRREAGAIVAFQQDGDLFKRTPLTIYNSTAASVATLRDTGCPGGIQCQPVISMASTAAAASDFINQIGSASKGSVENSVARLLNAGTVNLVVPAIYTTNTAAQLYFATTISSGTVAGNQIFGLGWYDTRGRV